MKKGDRERLTITLKSDILKMIDGTIDGVHIRNRSHAIEYYLESLLAPKVSKGIILAGGEGIRLRPFTYETPKAMLSIKGRPLLEHTIVLMRKYEIRDLLISVGRLGEKIKSYFGDGSAFGVHITYHDQHAKMGTAGVLSQLAYFVNNQPFILLYGDVLIDINLREFIEYHREHNGVITMVVTSVEKPLDWGVATLQGSHVIEFSEKPKKGTTHSHLVSAGVHVVEPIILTRIQPKGYAMLEDAVFPGLARKRQIVGYPFEGQWFDVSTPKIYAQVLKTWRT